MPYYVANIDPVALDLGFLVIRWYSLAYLVSFVVGYMAFRRLMALSPGHCHPVVIEKFFTLGAILLIVGGRLGEVLFYRPSYYLANPLKIFAVWEGGMSYHGGMLGVIAAAAWIAYRTGIRRLWITDSLVSFIPFGLGFGRLANFINGELWGKPTDVPWAVIFPRADTLPRHPSQLYEAFFEGFLLLLLLLILTSIPAVRRHLGLRSGVFMLGYGASRFGVEFFREPDGLMNIAGFILSTGQALTLPMFALGIGLIAYAMMRPPVDRLHLASEYSLSSESERAKQ